MAGKDDMGNLLNSQSLKHLDPSRCFSKNIHPSIGFSVDVRARINPSLRAFNSGWRLVVTPLAREKPLNRCPFIYSVKKATSSSHCFFVCASSELSISLSFFNFSFSPDKSDTCAVGVVVSTDPGFFESGDEVEVDPRSSPEFDDDDGPPPTGFPDAGVFAGGDVTVFRRRICERSSFWLRLKFSFANSHLSGTIFRKPCITFQFN
ncbi:hypothetical protein CFP56_004924 [Quercus suber]|uniref:Uncharacterized protein n=1 Tax=Quercus suber TaxID=58331 RepID=A0AAW0LAN2_QUESU